MTLKPYHRNYGNDMMGRVIQVTHKKRTRKQMTSMTIGLAVACAILITAILVVWKDHKPIPKRAPDAYEQLFGK